MDHSQTAANTLDLGHAGAREAIEDLIGVLKRSTEHASVRNCAAAALVKVGETDELLAFYLDSARAGTSELPRIAILGFTDIGPPAADVALPYIGEALRSSDGVCATLAVEALAKLGPPAEPLRSGRRPRTATSAPGNSLRRR
jgi:hypothetical protein